MSKAGKRLIAAAKEAREIAAQRKTPAHIHIPADEGAGMKPIKAEIEDLGRPAPSVWAWESREGVTDGAD